MKLFQLSSVVLCLSVLGCGGGIDKVPLVKVSGTLYLDDQPHGGVALILQPVVGGTSSPSASAEVGSDGKFTLMTYVEGDGAQPGDYAVQITGSSTGGGSTDPAAMMSALQVPSVEDAKVTIPKDGSENLEIKLKSKSNKGGPANTLLGN